MREPGEPPPGAAPLADAPLAMRERRERRPGAPPRAAERRLVRGAQRGSAEDFEALFALHWPRAYRTAWLVVHDAAAAEDIAQEAFIAALRALDSFDRRRPFGPWLSRIVVNRAIDWARARRLQAVPAGAPPASSEVALMGPRSCSRVLFRADGRFTRLRFSPSGRWLLVAWPLADQWVYLRAGASGPSKVLAAPNVTRRFRARGFPQLSGWCCPP